ADGEIAERGVHAVDLADDLDSVAGRQLGLVFGHDLLDVARDAAEIAAVSVGVNLVDRLNVGLVGVGRDRVAGERGDVAEQSGDWVSGGYVSELGDRRVLKVVERGHLVFGRLHGDVVRRAVARVGPEIGRNLLGRTQAGIQVEGDIVHGEAELRGAGAV